MKKMGSQNDLFSPGSGNTHNFPLQRDAVLKFWNTRRAYVLPQCIVPSSSFLLVAKIIKKTQVSGYGGWPCRLSLNSLPSVYGQESRTAYL